MSVNKILSFLHFAEKIKTTLRRSRTSKGRQESVADHSWRVTLMVILLQEELKVDFDVLKTLKMALIHDIVEGISGDIPMCVYYKNTEVKKSIFEKEKLAISEIKKMLPQNLGRHIYDIWMEFEKNESLEAKIVRAIDKIEGQMQFNETDISNWSLFDVKYSQAGISDCSSFNPYMKKFSKAVQKESLKKLCREDEKT